MTESETALQEPPAPAAPTRAILPDGFVGRQLGRRELEIYMRLVHVGMGIDEILAAQERAIEIVAAHDKVGRGRNQG